VVLGERVKGRVGEDFGAGDNFNFAIVLSAFLLVVWADEFFEILLIALEVLRAGQRILKQNDDRQEHLTAHFRVDALVLLQVDALFVSEDHID
jgi:hypothetical protein